MTHRAHNFSAGPAAIPLSVLERAQSELLDFGGTGMSIMEQSHRGPTYDAVHNRAIADLRSLMGISEDYEVLFMQGGARGQFAMLAMNLLGDGVGAYVDTGNWSFLAEKEAAKFGRTATVWSGREEGYRRVPAAGEIQVPADASYLHYTSNNTIYGTQFAGTPDPGELPLICDMSSDILSRPTDVSRFGLIYAGAQKNLGPAGVVVVIVRKDLLALSHDKLPETMSYKLMAAKNSMLNTPPTFAIYLVGLVAQHLVGLGGLDAVEAINERKAELLYRTIDESGGFYTPNAAPDSRSRMNVSFRSPSAELDGRFVAESAAAGLVGLKGHRSAGGLRASIYNAVPEESVRALVDFMGDFARRCG